ncbi:MAG: uncharacterized protein KVP18_004222 [Porospora cf. gigantea A]|uniref:uncharacterized protein n=1 Tax=Porospora cf. gigantea A TaxID=2853593 RepID=UPI0035599D59|nr:MAG: hypothetical protein KVP18_004222 [Porospora cf. gigantea A]
MIRLVSSRCGSLGTRLLQPYLYQSMQFVSVVPFPARRYFRRRLGNSLAVRRMTLMKAIQTFFDIASLIEECWRRIRTWVFGVLIWGAVASRYRSNHGWTRLIWCLVMFLEAIVLCVLIGLSVPKTLAPRMLVFPWGCVTMLVRVLPGFARACTHVSGAMS